MLIRSHEPKPEASGVSWPIIVLCEARYLRSTTTTMRVFQDCLLPGPGVGNGSPASTPFEANNARGESAKPRRKQSPCPFNTPCVPQARHRSSVISHQARHRQGKTASQNRCIRLQTRLPCVCQAQLSGYRSTPHVGYGNARVDRRRSQGKRSKKFNFPNLNRRSQFLISFSNSTWPSCAIESISYILPIPPNGTMGRSPRTAGFPALNPARPGRSAGTAHNTNGNK